MNICKHDKSCQKDIDELQRKLDTIRRIVEPHMLTGESLEAAIQRIITGDRYY